MRGLRAILGLIYLFGAPLHFYLALSDPRGYEDFSAWAPPITEISRDLWSWFLTYARYLALLIAVFELVVALLILYGGKPTKLGLLAALAFHLALAALFGMWLYTVPALLLIAWALRYDFDRAFDVG